MKKTGIIVLAFFMLSMVTKSEAQIEKLKSAFIYNFAKGTEWPASYKSGDFVIGILGKTPVSGELKKIAGARKIGAQKMTIKEFASAGSISKCHVLFVSEGSSGELASAVGKVGSTLIITEKSGLTKSGSAINFVLQGSKLRFEMNKANATSKKLKISGALEKMALK